jgi:circadian clock protein KaiB
VTDQTEPLQPAATYWLRLYIAGNTARSRRAIQNLQRICAEHVPMPIDLDVIDIYQQPELAGQQQIVAVPSLVRALPLPVRRIIGDLSETERVLQRLELTRVSGSDHRAV